MITKITKVIGKSADSTVPSCVIVNDLYIFLDKFYL